MSRLWCSISPTSNSEISWLTCILLHFGTSIVALHYVTLHVEVQPGIHVLIYSTGASKHPWTQAQIQEVLSGGVGWVFHDQRPKKKQPGQRFSSPPLILQFTEVVQWFYCRENYIDTFQRIERGANIFQWGPTFSRGGGIQMLISI